VIDDFEWRQLALTDRKFGKKIAGIRSINYPSAPSGHASESDVLDIAIVEFSDDVGPSFFRGSAYVLDDGTIGTPAIGNDLVVNGLFKDSTTIIDSVISPTFGLIEFTDQGAPGFDLALRRAEGRYVNPQWTSLTGFSGAPVFDVSAGRLAGMVVRASMPARDHAVLHYVDIVDIREALRAVANGTMQANYNKTVARLVSAPAPNAPAPSGPGTV
jgi:hypothetical protein